MEERIACVSSIDIKRNETAIISLAQYLRVPFRYYSAEQLMSLEGEFSSSEFVRSVTSVDCVSERSAMMPYGGELIRRKTAEDGMTLAVSRREMTVRF